MDRPREMEARGERRNKDAAVCPTDDEAVTPAAHPNKQSVDYLWRSGLAGGLAGCAVRDPHPSPPTRTLSSGIRANSTP